MEKLNNLKLFAIYTAAALSLGYIAELLLVNEGLVIEHFEQRVSNDVLYHILDWRQKWNWLTYALLPLISIIQFSLISLCLYVGVYLLDYPISLSRIFKVVLISEFVFLIPALIKLIWFGLILTNYSLTDLQFYSPLSILQIYDPTYVQSWLIYPLSTLNVFELAYWIVLSVLLGKELSQNFDRMFGLVSSTYGIGLFLWVVMVTFITVSLS